MRREEWARKLVHVPGGLLPPAFVYLYGWTGSVAIAVFLLSYTLVAWDFGRRRVHLPIAWMGIRWTRRPNEAGPVGAIEFFTAILILGVLFPLPYFFGAMALLGVGDGMAALVGQRWGRHKLPWHDRKTWEGLAAGLVFGVPAFVGFGIIGGVMQQHGYDAGAGLHKTWPVLPFLLLGFLVLHAGARAIVAARWARRVANATPTQIAGAFGASLAPAAAALLTLPLLLDGPLLPAWGGHTTVTQVLLVATPVVAMIVESALRRHDNLVVPFVAAALAYVTVGLSG